MVKSSSCSENESCCSKDCKKNTETLNKKITDLSDKLFDANNMIYHYKLALAQVESRLVEYTEREKLETLKEEKKGVNGKLAGLLKASKDLDNLIERQMSDKNKDGLGYSDVPSPAAQLYISPKKDLSWTGLPECADDTVTDYSRPSPTVESTSGDDQNRNSSASENGESTDNILSKSAVKKSTVRGNQRNWNNLKSQQLGENFVRKNRACFNYGHFDHLSYDYGLGVKKGTTRPQNNTHKSMPPRPAIHRPYRPPMRTTRPNTNAVTRPYVNSARPQTTQELMIILIHRVQRLERELKARTSVHKVDRGRSRPVMAWVPKKSLVRSFDQQKNKIQDQQKKTMVKSSSCSENEPCCSKDCKKNTESPKKSPVKFVKPKDSQSKSKTGKTKSPKKYPVKYAEQYRKPNKKPNVRGNQRNWNNLKTHQLGPDFVMKKKACFNWSDFNHLAYDCRKRVRKSFTPKPIAHRPYRPSQRPVKANMNGTRPNRTSFNKQAHSYANRPFHRISAVRSPHRAPWVSTVNRYFPPVNRKFSPGSRNFPTANRKFHTGSIKCSTTDMEMKGKAVKPSDCWFWKPSHNLSNKGLKNNSVSVMFKKYTYIDTQGRLKSVMAWVPKEN
nr:hypothetical protein [Tanacetum cinerariifolium]